MTAIFPAFFTSDFILPYGSGRGTCFAAFYCTLSYLSAKGKYGSGREALLRSIYCTLYRMQNHSKKGGKRNSVQYKKPAMNIKL